MRHKPPVRPVCARNPFRLLSWFLMLLLTGPPGSGRTSHILAEFRQALRRDASDIRLLTPTATMAEHLRHKLAREGLVLRPHLVQTLSQFLTPWVEDLPQISPAALY